LISLTTIKQGSKDEFTVYYSGNPTIAKRAPWDGGVVFTTDSLGKPWVATACEGVGAPIWWPNKDQLTDEVDSILISVSVPKGLKDVSNGRLRKVTDLKDGYTNSIGLWVAPSIITMWKPTLPIMCILTIAIWAKTAN
jgi:aminopeptidase N